MKRIRGLKGLINAVGARVLRMYGGAPPDCPDEIMRIAHEQIGIKFFPDYHSSLWVPGFVAELKAERWDELIEAEIYFNPDLRHRRKIRLRRGLIHDIAEYIAICYAPALPGLMPTTQRFYTGAADLEDVYHIVAQRIEARFCGRRR